MAKGNNPKQSKGNTLDFETQLWAAADIFRADLYPKLKVDFIFANPPFHISDWGDKNLRQTAVKLDALLQHDIGVSISHAYVVKHIDSDYFEEA